MKQYFNLKCFLIISSLLVGLTNCGHISNSKEVEITEGLAMASIKYDNLGNFVNGLAIVENDNKFGFINLEGTEIIPCIYEEASNFSDGLATVKLDSQWGAIDISGKTVIPFHYQYLGNFQDGIASFTLAPYKGLINKKEQIVTNLSSIYFISSDLIDGLFIFESDGKQSGYGFMNEKGEIIIKPIYEDVLPFSEGLAAVKYNDLWGYIDKKGKYIIQPQYLIAEPFSEGLAAIEKNSSDWFGYIDMNNNIRIPYGFRVASNFHEGLACVKNELKYGYINYEGEVVIPYIYEMASDFKDGLAAVQKDGKWGFVDSKGSTVIPFKYDFVKDFSDGLAQVTILKDGLSIQGYVNKKGEDTFSLNGGLIMELLYEKNKAKELQKKTQKLELELKEKEQMLSNGNNLNWLYGVWEGRIDINDPYLGYLHSNVRMEITENRIFYYMDNKLKYSGPYRVANNRLYYGDYYSTLNEPNRIDLGDGNYAYKIQ